MGLILAFLSDLAYVLRGESWDKKLIWHMYLGRTSGNGIDLG